MKKILRLWDVVFMNVAAMVGPRWLPFAATYGAASIFMWSAAALLFFIPVSLIAAELGTTWPREGGLYIWVKEAYGDKMAFMAAWFYWINSFFYWGSLFTFIAVVVAFFIDPALAKNKFFVCSTALIGIWAVTLANIKGMKVIRVISDLGGTLGTIVPGLIVIGLGFTAYFIWHRPSATNFAFTASNWLPNFGHGNQIVNLSYLMFSMAGIELSMTMAGSIRDPKKTLARSTFISALIIIGIYAIGTIALNLVISPTQVTASSGIMDAVKIIADQFHIKYIIIIMALALTIGNIGGASMWLVGPIKMFFECCGKDGMLPKKLTKLDKNELPANAMILQACIVTFLIIITSLLPSVNVFYETLILMATITYFLPYLAMFAAFIKLRKTQPHKERPFRIFGNHATALVIAFFASISVLIAIAAPFIAAPADIKSCRDLLIYHSELFGGVLLFSIIGYMIYSAHETRQKKLLQNKL